ncbi:glycosyltransferase [Mucilaginibacter daejeonensis]|uniref:glycosyltransferase family 4 protein n=1 Tax=Mucilaginibacter daejeonensis TaxID=398049 RepID=UPI001D17D041|nr:glycosyltransferase [Mucilaginibacter daejeonensis]UEG52971.1 glycosyltransferase [Mucilaginibacter daejeonensis]
MKKADIAHLLYLEGNIHIVDCLKEVPANLLGTIHLPFDKWPQAKLDCLHRLKNAIILYEEDISKFQTYMNNGNITFIRHGVDLDFFKPDDKVSVNKNKVLFVGHYLRDFDMMVEVYRSITDTVSSKIEFHFVLAEHFRDTNAIKYLLQQPNVIFHANLSDEELLQQYQSSYVMLMPLASSGANTAIVQGLAIGLPIITNDIGGIRSYGGGDVFEIAPNNDAGALVQLFKKYYADEKFRDSISAAQRRFSVECLDWRISAAQHLSLYKSLVK